jgi:cytochrome c biogenesis protein CcdA
MAFGMSKVALAVVAIVAGILVLVWPDLIRWVIGIFLIVWGILSLLDKKT